MHRLRTAAFVALGVIGLAIVTSTVAWAVDGDGGDRVSRNVELAGIPIGGLDATRLRAVVDRLAARYPATPVHIEAGTARLTTKAGDVGIAVDRDATVRAALEVGDSGSLPGRVWSWATSFVRDRTAPVKVEVDERAARRVIDTLDTGPRTAPVEPRIEVDGDRFRAVAGKPGEGIDPARVVGSLPDAARGGGPIEVEVERGKVPPRFTMAEARALARKVDDLVDDGLAVKAGSATATVPAKTLREWVTSRAGDEGLELAVETDEAVAGLKKLLPDGGTRPVDAGFAVQSGGVVITPARPGTACCAPGAAGLVEQALREGADGPVDLPLAEERPRRDEEAARKLGIKEQVSTFTTRHKCCESRVTNIHRIADIVRGAVIPPGGTFSVNEHVGKRTREKGFVTAGVIENGEFAEDVGGGVSQFATTLFNAAFFAGLEFGEYQSHSLYISRYPYGREATMGHPHPDLQVKNVTPHGVLIWPSYTSTSITVSMYSTKYYSSVDSLAQSKRPRGSCTVVTTPRQRTLLDGTKKTDRVFATYRAAEGVNCNESPTTQPAPTTTAPATTAAPSPTTAPPPRPSTTARPATTTTAPPRPSTTARPG